MDFRRIFPSLLRELNRENKGHIESWSINNKTQGFFQFKKDAKAQERPF